MLGQAVRCAMLAATTKYGDAPLHKHHRLIRSSAPYLYLSYSRRSSVLYPTSRLDTGLYTASGCPS